MSGFEAATDLIAKQGFALRDLQAERDELHATLSGLCSFLGVGTPDASTTAVEMNRRIHWGFDLHARLAREKAEKERDDLRDILLRMLMAWGTGELFCDVANGRWWPALEDAKKLLGVKL